MKRIMLRRILVISCLLNVVIFFALLRLRRVDNQRLPPGWTGIERTSQYRSLHYLERRLHFDLTRLEKKHPRAAGWPQIIFQISFAPSRPWYHPFMFGGDAAADARSEREAMKTWTDMNPGFQHIVSAPMLLRRLF
jgi:hypothetical protein